MFFRVARKNVSDFSISTPHMYTMAIVKGYSCFWKDGKWIPHHRWIMEQHLGRTLSADEVVHHINHDKLDNRIENLEVMDRRAHSCLHHPIQPDPETKTCTRCGATKPTTKFAIRGTSKSGKRKYRGFCIECDKVRQRISRQRRKI